MVQLSHKNTFAVYSLPNDENHYLVQQRHSGLTPFDVNKKGFAFHPFETSQQHPALLIRQDVFVENPSFSFHSMANGSASPIVAISKRQYLKKVRQFINHTQHGFSKLIFSRIKTQRYAKGTGDLSELFINLKQAYPQAFVYLVHVPQIGCWMGASPEILLTENKGLGETVALAGTQAYQQQVVEDTVWGQKEIAEQAYVSDYIKNLLENRGISYYQNEPQTVRAGQVVHIKTHFQFRANGDLQGLVQDLHPTPAVCGLPKMPAKRFIIDHEPHDRAYYCGFLGPVNIHKKTQLYVNLRSMQVFSNRFALYVGGGITKDSVAEKEWEETEMKAQTLLRVIEQVYAPRVIAS